MYVYMKKEQKFQKLGEVTLKMLIHFEYYICYIYVIK